MKLTITSHPFADWFFPLVSLRVIRLTRISVGLVLLGTWFMWLPHVHAFFTNEGMISAQTILKTSTYSHLSLFFLNDAVWFVYFCFGLFALGILGLITGMGGRLSAIVTYLMFLSFASRLPLVFYGAIDILHTTLFFLMFLPAAGYRPWSAGGVEERNRLVPSWAMRMLQLALCIVYFFAAMQKVRYNTWWNGTEILASLSTRFGAFDFYWLSRYPLLVNLMTYGSWMSEVAFPFLVWNRATHRFSLIMIAGMHVGIWFLMNASLFSPAMLANLAAFLTPEDEARLAELWQKYGSRFAKGWNRLRAARA